MGCNKIRYGQKRIIGILGGLGPRAHILFEEQLLTEAVNILGAEKDPDFPSWVLASFPATPDRTRALRLGGESPLPAMRSALARLAAAGADFAVPVCNTSFAFLRGGDLPLPVLNMPATTACAAAAWGVRRAGVLATSGALEAGVFKAAFISAGVDSVSFPDLPGGEADQLDLVMTAIYGPGGGMGGKVSGGIKGRGATSEAADLLLAAGKILAAAGADALVMGCTEISLVAERLSDVGLRLIDPIAICAEAAIRHAFGLPFAGCAGDGEAGIWEKCFL